MKAPGRNKGPLTFKYFMRLAYLLGLENREIKTSIKQEEKLSLELISTKITVYTDAYNVNNVEHLKGTRLG